MSGRYALLIGNSEFQDDSLSELAAPRNDVMHFSEVLEDREIGNFETKLLINSDLVKTRKAIVHLFSHKYRDDLVLLYYTGHGLKDEYGNLYLALPATRKSDPTEIALEAAFVRLQRDRNASHRQILILDCCYSGAFVHSGAKALTDSVHLHPQDFDSGGHGRFILAASAANESAFEHDGQSIFTRHLVEALRTGDAAPDKSVITVQDLHEYVSRRVAAEDAPMKPRFWADEQTDPVIIAKNPRFSKALLAGIDRPWNLSSVPVVGIVTQLVDNFRQSDQDIANKSECELRMRLEQSAELSYFAKRVIWQALEARNAVALGKAESPNERNRSTWQFPLSTFRAIVEPWCPEVVALPTGLFTMGSPESEIGRYGDEGPQREVKISSFAIGRYPITFAEYDYFCDASGYARPDHRGWGRGRMPVINVSWLDATAYTQWLSKITKQQFRLPSEAEWEYAARTATQTAYWWGETFESAMANSRECDRRQTTEVGRYPPNPWGLYDMSGNIWEWVEDIWHFSFVDAPNDEKPWLASRNGVSHARTMRGGAWHSHCDFARSAARLGTRDDLCGDGLGFRVALSL